MMYNDCILQKCAYLDQNGDNDICLCPEVCENFSGMSEPSVQNSTMRKTKKKKRRRFQTTLSALYCTPVVPIDNCLERYNAEREPQTYIYYY